MSKIGTGVRLGSEETYHRVQERYCVRIAITGEIDIRDVKCAHHIVVLVHQVVAMKLWNWLASLQVRMA